MRVAVIGTGRMGQRHMQSIRKLGLQIVGIHDKSREALDQASQNSEISNEKKFSNAVEMLKRVKADCVVIATVAPSHCLYTCLAAEHGARFILCEKPMAVSLDECQKMIDVCQRRGVKLAINHPMRFMKHYMEIKRIVQSEVMGGLSSVTVVGGNVGLSMNGTHFIEMFRYITEERPVEATAWFSSEKVPNPRGVEFEDSAGSLRLITARGKRFYMEIGADQGHGIQAIYSGPYGQIVMDVLSGDVRLTVREKKDRLVTSTNYATPSIQTTYKIALEDSATAAQSVLDALLKDMNPPSGEHGKLAIAALVAAYQSNEAGHRAVPIDINLDQKRRFPWA